MERFDAELYLRLLAEQMLVAPTPHHRDPWGSPVSEPARALVAVGAITAEDAQRVIDDYAMVRALRTENGASHVQHLLSTQRTRAAHPQEPEPLKPRRVVACDASLEIGQGTLRVRHVLLSEDETKLGVIWRPNLTPSTTPRAIQRAFLGHPGAPPKPRVIDDRGTSADTHFSGGGSDHEWQGALHTDRPLAPDTAWIELDGKRCELPHQPASFEITIEPLPQQPPAHQYLWQRLATADRHPGPAETLEPILDALIAAHQLDPEDPVVARARSVAARLPRRPGFHPPAGRSAMGLPEPWKSLLRRADRHDGPDGSIAIGAITPRFDGFTIAVFSLDSAPGHFSCEVELTPGVSHRGPFSAEMDPREIAWWAADDRGNHYLGTMGHWSGGPDRSEGEIQFGPALDPKAHRLDLLPTAQTSRARITLQLPWADQPETTQRQT